MARNKNQLLITDIWKSITSAAKRSRKPSYVAVVYFGQGASEMLPLRPNSRLVVDASENAEKSGQTHPADLKALQITPKPYILGLGMGSETSPRVIP